MASVTCALYRTELSFILPATIQGWSGECHPLHFTDEENEAQRHVCKAIEPVRGDQDLKTGHSGS